MQVDNNGTDIQPSLPLVLLLDQARQEKCNAEQKVGRLTAALSECEGNLNDLKSVNKAPIEELNADKHSITWLQATNSLCEKKLEYTRHEHRQTPTIFHLRLWTFALLLFYLDMDYLGILNMEIEIQILKFGT